MDTAELVEGLLMEVGFPFEELEQGMWLVTDQSGGIRAVVTASGPVVDIRIRLAALPDPPPQDLLVTLLELNATELLYGAYGLDNGAVVLVEVFTSRHLDLELFREALDALFMSVATQRGIILRALEAAQSGQEA